VPEIPEFVYLVTVDAEWPVSAIADDHPSIAERVEDVVTRRRKSENVYRPDQVHVWKARLTDVREVDLLPAATTRPSLRERDQPTREEET
jgi:hypothetical protein